MHAFCEFAICGMVQSKYLTFLESSPRPLADLGLPSNLTRYDRISSSVLDPEPDPDPEGSETFSQIRIRSGTEINVSDLDSKPGPETIISNPVSDPERLFRFRIRSGCGQKFRILPVPDPHYWFHPILHICRGNNTNSFTGSKPIFNRFRKHSFFLRTTELIFISVLE